MSRKRIIISGAIVVAGLALYFRPIQNAELSAVLDRAAAADRIIVEQTRFGGPALNAFVVDGNPAVRAFREQLSFSRIGGICECGGDLRYRFFKGDIELMVITHHHQSHLRGPWRGGDAYLTWNAQRNVSAWIEQHRNAAVEKK